MRTVAGLIALSFVVGGCGESAKLDKPRSGYKVVFVPFSGGEPAGNPVDVITGFLSKDEKAMGRPVGVEIARDGSLLVADDVGNRIWRVSLAAPAR